MCRSRTAPSAGCGRAGLLLCDRTRYRFLYNNRFLDRFGPDNRVVRRDCHSEFRLKHKSASRPQNLHKTLSTNLPQNSRGRPGRSGFPFGKLPERLMHVTPSPCGLRESAPRRSLRILTQPIVRLNFAATLLHGRRIPFAPGGVIPGERL